MNRRSIIKNYCVAVALKKKINGSLFNQIEELGNEKHNHIDFK